MAPELQEEARCVLKEILPRERLLAYAKDMGMATPEQDFSIWEAEATLDIIQDIKREWESIKSTLGLDVSLAIPRELVVECLEAFHSESGICEKCDQYYTRSQCDVCEGGEDGKLTGEQCINCDVAIRENWEVGHRGPDGREILFCRACSKLFDNGDLREKFAEYYSPSSSQESGGSP